MRMFPGQLIGLAALLLALLIGAAAIVLPMPEPPELLPVQTTPNIAPSDEHLGVGAACSRQWMPIAELAEAVRDPIVSTPVTPPDGIDEPAPRPRPQLNWRYVNLITVTHPDGRQVQAAVVRVDGVQRVLTVGDMVPAPGPDQVEVLEITDEKLRIKRGEEESEIERDDDMRLMEQRGFGV